MPPGLSNLQQKIGSTLNPTSCKPEISASTLLCYPLELAHGKIQKQQLVDQPTSPDEEHPIQHFLGLTLYTPALSNG